MIEPFQPSHSRDQSASGWSASYSLAGVASLDVEVCGDALASKPLQLLGWGDLIETPNFFEGARFKLKVRILEAGSGVGGDLGTPEIAIGESGEFRGRASYGFLPPPDGVGELVVVDGRFLRQELENYVRALCYMRLPDLGALPLHAASVVTPGGRGVLLCGRSGAGKSTASRELEAQGLTVVHDDISVAVRDAHGRWFVSSLPFAAGKVCGEVKAPLGVVCRLYWGDRGMLAKLEGAEAAAAIVSSSPSGGLVKSSPRVLELASDLAASVPVWRVIRDGSESMARLLDVLLGDAGD